LETFGDDLMKVALECGDASRIGEELARLGQAQREQIVLGFENVGTYASFSRQSTIGLMRRWIWYAPLWQERGQER
jgi:hypothetical protein